MTKMLPSFKLLVDYLSCYSCDKKKKLSFLAMKFNKNTRPHFDKSNMMEKSSCLTHFFLAPLVLEEWKFYWVSHLLFAVSLESLFCKELICRSSPLDSCIILTKDKSNNCFNYSFKIKSKFKTYASCRLHVHYTLQLHVLNQSFNQRNK